MGYYFSKIVDAPFEEAVARTREALAQEGFGVITEIDVTKTLKTKIGADFRPYLILGACNPALAHEALKLEDKVGTMLPCNVVVQDAGGGRSDLFVGWFFDVSSALPLNHPWLGKLGSLAIDLDLDIYGGSDEDI